MKLAKVGDIVIVVDSLNCFKKYPGIVTEICSDDQFCVSVVVFDRKGTVYYFETNYSQSLEIGTWHWPEEQK